MSVLYKWTATKPSLEDSFAFEIDLVTMCIPYILYGSIPDAIGSLGYPDGGSQSFIKPIGYIGSHLENATTWDEISSRIDEVRIDLKDLLTSPCYDHGLSGQIPLEFFVSSGAIPTINPFSTNYILIMEFDTWDNFIAAYKNDQGLNDIISNGGKPKGLEWGLTFLEEFLEDGVTKEFVGNYQL
jgi:hypothetical protein